MKTEPTAIKHYIVSLQCQYKLKQFCFPKLILIPKKLHALL